MQEMKEILDCVWKIYSTKFTLLGYTFSLGHVLTFCFLLSGCLTILYKMID